MYEKCPKGKKKGNVWVEWFTRLEVRDAVTSGRVTASAGRLALGQDADCILWQSPGWTGAQTS
jgi:hypothetical protein